MFSLVVITISIAIVCNASVSFVTYFDDHHSTACASVSESFFTDFCNPLFSNALIIIVLILYPVFHCHWSYKNQFYVARVYRSHSKNSVGNLDAQCKSGGR